MKSIVVCVIVIISAVRSEYPSNFPKCKYNDEPCLKKAANEVIQKYSSGLHDVNLLPFDPLHVKSVVLEKNPSSPVNVEFKFKDMDLAGLKNMKVSSFSGFNPDLKGRTVFEAFIPNIILTGHYTMDGRVILLPITGDGPCELKIKNTKIKYSFDLKPVQKDGQVYASLEHVKLEMDPEIVNFHFDNLFNGDKTLGDNMNQFMNENWRDIYSELAPGFSKALGLIVKSTMNTFFEKYPYAEYFH